jgi:hypothetical protein
LHSSLLPLLSMNNGPGYSRVLLLLLPFWDFFLDTQPSFPVVLELCAGGFRQEEAMPGVMIVDVVPFTDEV